MEDSGHSHDAHVADVAWPRPLRLNTEIANLIEPRDMWHDFRPPRAQDAKKLVPVEIGRPREIKFQPPTGCLHLRTELRKRIPERRRIEG